jgi:hypothetical protein
MLFQMGPFLSFSQDRGDRGGTDIGFDSGFHLACDTVGLPIPSEILTPRVKKESEIFTGRNDPRDSHDCRSCVSLHRTGQLAACHV